MILVGDAVVILRKSRVQWKTGVVSLSLLQGQLFRVTVTNPPAGGPATIDCRAEHLRKVG